MLSLLGPQVRSLVGELTSRKPPGVTKKKMWLISKRVSVSPRSATVVESVNENVHTSVPLKKLDSSCVHSCVLLCLECQAGELEISQT